MHGPQTRADLIAAASEGFTDCFVFSHGWNNDWDKAVGRYEDFLHGYVGMRREHGLESDRPFVPLLVGIFWPSTSLVLPWERAPEIAAGTFTLSPEEREDVDALAEFLEPADRERLHEFAALNRELGNGELGELAAMLAPLMVGDDELGLGGVTPVVDDVIAALGDEDDGGYDESGRYGTIGGATQDPEAAFLGLGTLRKALRLTTVRVMKDRAGTVGTVGVGPLVRELSNGKARLHLVGHSYGCKVVLSAVAASGVDVNSMLLLQPAVSRLCFARDAGNGRPGGYRQILERVRAPILATYSKRDSALRRFFHLALRRGSDLGEAQIAAAGPSRFAALGGYGPGGCGDECKTEDMRAVGDWYNLDDEELAVVGVRSHDRIKGHGDISHEGTWWALHNLVGSRRGGD